MSILMKSMDAKVHAIGKKNHLQIQVFQKLSFFRFSSSGSLNGVVTFVNANVLNPANVRLSCLLFYWIVDTQLSKFPAQHKKLTNASFRSNSNGHLVAINSKFSVGPKPALTRSNAKANAKKRSSVGMLAKHPVTNKTLVLRVNPSVEKRLCVVTCVMTLATLKISIIFVGKKSQFHVLIQPIRLPVLSFAAGFVQNYAIGVLANISVRRMTADCCVLFLAKEVLVMPDVISLCPVAIGIPL